jgi:hypothetical protein
MRLVAVTLTFALLSLGFAPAPFPKAPRQTTLRRELREADRRLESLGVNWRIEGRGRSQIVRFSWHPAGSCLAVGAAYPVLGGDLVGALRDLASEFERGRSRDK